MRLEQPAGVTRSKTRTDAERLPTHAVGLPDFPSRPLFVYHERVLAGLVRAGLEGVLRPIAARESPTTWMMRRFRSLLKSSVCGVATLLTATVAVAQDDFIRSADAPPRFQMLVYVTGEVKKPGEYLVSDTADVASLVMMAGGATEFGSLSDLTIRRGRGVAGFGNPETPTVERFDLERYLEAKDGTAAPRLNPGDVVHVPSNAWFAWDRSFSMIRDVAVIVTTVLLYIRVVEQN